VFRNRLGGTKKGKNGRNKENGGANHQEGQCGAIKEAGHMEKIQYGEKVGVKGISLNNTGMK